MKAAAKQDAEEKNWQFYLAKVYDQSFMQWREGLDG